MLASDPGRASWAGLVDFERLAVWMDSQGLGAGDGPLEAPRLLGGGTQNVLVHFRRGARTFVLRRPAPSPRPDSDATMRREARVLAALAGTGVPHPALIAACDDAQVLGAAFFLMAPVDGFNAAAEGLPPLHAADPAVRHAMGLAMVDAIATLGRLDPGAIGLAGLGRPEGFLGRQVRRWRQQLDSYHLLPGWPGPAALPEVEALGRWLDERCPPPALPGLMHGDFHLANVLFRYDGPKLAAVVDWELSTIGDPLLDLGWLLATWPQPDGSHHNPHRIKPWQGFPTAEELVQAYAERSPRDLSAIRWYTVLACFKLAIVLEGSHARACAGRAPVDTGRRLHRSAVGLLQRAAAWASASGAAV